MYAKEAFKCTIVEPFDGSIHMLSPNCSHQMHSSKQAAARSPPNAPHAGVQAADPEEFEEMSAGGKLTPSLSSVGPCLPPHCCCRLEGHLHHACDG